MHVRSIILTTPRQYEMLLDRMQRLRIPVEGPLMRGYTMPCIMDIHIWDTRIKREGVSRYLQMLNVIDPGNTETFQGSSDKRDLNSNNQAVHLPHKWLIVPAVRFLRYLIKHNPKYGADNNLPPVRPIIDKGWHSAIFLSTADDPEKRHLNEEL